jgi:hypothetical protein
MQCLSNVLTHTVSALPWRLLAGGGSLLFRAGDGMQPDVMLVCSASGMVTTGLTARFRNQDPLQDECHHPRFLPNHPQTRHKSPWQPSRNRAGSTASERAVTFSEHHIRASPASAPIRGAYSYRPGEGSAKPVDQQLKKSQRSAVQPQPHCAWPSPAYPPSPASCPRPMSAAARLPSA